MPANRRSITRTHANDLFFRSAALGSSRGASAEEETTRAAKIVQDRSGRRPQPQVPEAAEGSGTARSLLAGVDEGPALGGGSATRTHLGGPRGRSGLACPGRLRGGRGLGLELDALGLGGAGDDGERLL